MPVSALLWRPTLGEFLMPLINFRWCLLSSFRLLRGDQLDGVFYLSYRTQRRLRDERGGIVSFRGTCHRRPDDHDRIRGILLAHLVGLRASLEQGVCRCGLCWCGGRDGKTTAPQYQPSLDESAQGTEILQRWSVRF